MGKGLLACLALACGCVDLTHPAVFPHDAGSGSDTPAEVAADQPRSSDLPPGDAPSSLDVLPDASPPDAAPPVPDVALEGRPEDAAGPASHRKSLTVVAGRVGQTLQQFPLLIATVNDPDLARLARGAADLRVTAADGVTSLPVEVELFDQATGALVLWVRVPQLPAGTPTRLLLHFGGAATPAALDPKTVWSPDWQEVWHLGESGGGTVGEYRDATGKGAHGQGGGGASQRVPVRAPGKLGHGQQFDGTDDYIALPSGAVPRREGTLSHWSLKTGLGPEIGYYEAGAMGALDGFGFGSGPGFELHSGWGAAGVEYDLAFFIWSERPGANVSMRHMGPLPTNRWIHTAYTWAPDGELLMYVDGQRRDRASRAGETWGQIATVFRALGRPRQDDSDRTLTGVMDEVRVASVARTAAWIAAEFANQSQPQAFVDIGPLQAGN